MTNPTTTARPSRLTLSSVLGELRVKVDANEPVIQTLPCGLGLLDNTVGGLIRGEYVGMIGAPGCGKSSIADQAIVGVLRRNTNARGLIFALETHPLVRAARLAANMAVKVGDNDVIEQAVPTDPLLKGQLRADRKAWIIKAIDQLKAELGERLRFSCDLTFASEIVETIRSERPDVIEVDHLGLVKSDGGGDELFSFDENLRLLVDALRSSEAAGVLINEVNKLSLKDGMIDMAASRGSARFASLAAAFIGLICTPGSPDTEPEVVAALTKSRFGPSRKQQRARFFDGLTYFDWGDIENIVAEERSRG